MFKVLTITLDSAQLSLTLKNVAIRDDYALSELLTRNAQSVENVRFIKVDWESLRRPPQASP